MISSTTRWDPLALRDAIVALTSTTVWSLLRTPTLSSSKRRIFIFSPGAKKYPGYLVSGAGECQALAVLRCGQYARRVLPIERMSFTLDPNLRWLDRLEKRLGWLAIPNIASFLVGLQIIGF